MSKPSLRRPLSGRSNASANTVRPSVVDHEKQAKKRNEDAWKAEQMQNLARYYDSSERVIGKHGEWTAPEYYERMDKEARKLADKYDKERKLKERRNKLQLMLFKENQEYNDELKRLSKMPKYYKNGSYFNEIPTSVLKDINQGIKEKENQLRKQEAELMLYHQWRANQPAVREAERYCRNGALKSAWRDQMVERAITKKKEEDELKMSIKERDAYIKKQIEIEKENMKEKDVKMKELREYLERQIEDLKLSEVEVKNLRRQEEKEHSILSSLQSVTEERKRDADKLMQEREATVINMGMHKYKLRRRAFIIEKDIECDIVMLKRLEEATLNEFVIEQAAIERNRTILDEIRTTLQAQKEMEKKRQLNIEAMYDGEARLMSEKQEKIWKQEREARHLLMNEVVETLKKQIDARIESNREQQRQNILERERMLADIERINSEMEDEQNKKKEQMSQYGKVTQLQNELQKLKREEKELHAKQEQEQAVKKAIEDEERLKKELIRVQKDGCRSPIYNRRKIAWIP